MPMATPTMRITSRPTSPSLSGMSAKPDAIPVAKGFTVEPITPIPQPSRTTDAPTSAS